MAKPKRPTDSNQRAKFIVDLVTGDEIEKKKDKEKALKEPKGQKGGKVGGNARANKLSAEKRTEIAKKAANKRWEK